MPIRPSDNEEEYFTRRELERRRQAETERAAAEQEAERRRRREAHFMKCPKCGADLVEVDYHAVRVDRCPECDGLWLDGGELEEITGRDRSVVRRLLSLFDQAPGPPRH